jgi:hypothetical protein
MTIEESQKGHTRRCTGPVGIASVQGGMRDLIRQGTNKGIGMNGQCRA